MPCRESLIDVGTLYKFYTRIYNAVMIKYDCSLLLNIELLISHCTYLGQVIMSIRAKQFHGLWKYCLRWHFGFATKNNLRFNSIKLIFKRTEVALWKQLLKVAFLKIEIWRILYYIQKSIYTIPRILLKIVLCLFRYRMRLYVNYTTTSNVNSWMMLI